MLAVGARVFFVPVAWLTDLPGTSPRRFYEILADRKTAFLPSNAINMTTKLIQDFGTIIRVHLRPNK